MTAVAFILLIVAAQDPVDKIATLIEKLGSDEIVAREAAVKELSLLGYGAVPALRKAAAESVGEKKVLLDRLIDNLTIFGRPVIVTLDAKDRPLREVAADLERQTGISIHLTGSAADTPVTLAAKGAVIWKVIENLCRARGNLMYRFRQDSIEIFPGKFRELPSVDHQSLRFFVDRFIWDWNRNPPGGMQFYMEGAVLTPPGTKLIWMEIQVEELRDDKGLDLAHIPEGWRGFLPEGCRFGLNSKRIIFPQTYRPTTQGSPTFEATKFTRFRGKVAMLFAGGERLLGRVTNPLARPSTPARAELPAFGVDRWRLLDGYLVVDFTAGWEAEAVKGLSYKLAPLMVLRFQDGDWAPPFSEHCFQPGPDGMTRRQNTVSIGLPDGAEVASIDVVVPDPIL
ncbi:MAG TPA: hypothetical protein VFC86_02960, partial [Planctomycetota bacterium]|nr:hypothetical protein [Planctomycetota bacterium]